MAKKSKIRFIHPDLGIGGAERLVLDVASALSKHHYEIEFLTNHFDKTHAFEELKSGEYPVHVIGNWLPRSIFGKCQALCAYIRMVYLTLFYLLFVYKNDKPDLFFIDLIPISIPFLKLFKKTKVIYYCHHPDLLASEPGGQLKRFYRKPIDWLEVKSTSLADVILVNSEYTASVFRKTFPEIMKPIDVLYPTIAFSFQEAVKNLNEFNKPISEVVPEILSNRKDLFVFLSINRFHPAKKLDLAIHAMEELKNLTNQNDWERVFFLMAGGYDPQSQINEKYYNDLVSLTSSKLLNDKIIFMKSPSDDLKINLLKLCSCLVYTPVKEHFGIVPLEAMAVGKPVIACNSGGPRETVEQDETGFLCEPNASDMAKHMKLMLNKNCDEMGEKGKQRLEDKFSYDSFTQKLNRVVTYTLLNKY